MIEARFNNKAIFKYKPPSRMRSMRANLTSPDIKPLCYFDGQKDIVTWVSFIRMLGSQNILQILFALEICSSSKSFNNFARFLKELFWHVEELTELSFGNSFTECTPTFVLIVLPATSMKPINATTLDWRDNEGRHNYTSTDEEYCSRRNNDAAAPDAATANVLPPNMWGCQRCACDGHEWGVGQER